jgi:hypothetical protein
LTAWQLGGAALWLFWPAVSLLLVSANYAVLGPNGFQKRSDGRMSVAALVLFAPYLVGAWINSRLWTRQEPKPVLIGDGVWLGRIPSRRAAAAFSSIVDVCAELPSPRAGAAVHAFPMLDLVPPGPDQIAAAAACIETLRAGGAVLACCALGYSRSAAVVAAWLVRTGRAANAAGAVHRVRARRPRIAIDPATSEAIALAAGGPP